MVAVEFEPYQDKKGNWQAKAGRLRLQVIKDFSAEQLLGFITKNVEPFSIIYTDALPSYNKLKEAGYTHGAEKAAMLPVLHRVVSNLKSWLQGTHKGAVRRKHLQAYLNEFTFRFNRRKSPWWSFNRALGLATHTEERPEYRTLYEAGEEGGWRHPNPEES